MARYRVTVREIHNQDYIVDAGTREQAKQLVAAGGGDMDESSFSYNSTLNPEYWPEPVIEK
jgi:hypothetical protein